MRSYHVVISGLGFDLMFYDGMPEPMDVHRALSRRGLTLEQTKGCSWEIREIRDGKYDFGPGRTYRRGVYRDTEGEKEKARLSQLWRESCEEDTQKQRTTRYLERRRKQRRQVQDSDDSLRVESLDTQRSNVRSEQGEISTGRGDDNNRNDGGDLI